MNTPEPVLHAGPCGKRGRTQHPGPAAPSCPSQDCLGPSPPHPALGFAALPWSWAVTFSRPHVVLVRISVSLSHSCPRGFSAHGWRNQSGPKESQPRGGGQCERRPFAWPPEFPGRCFFFTCVLSRVVWFTHTNTHTCTCNMYTRVPFKIHM